MDSLNLSEAMPASDQSLDPPKLPNISIVIPTLKRVELLERLLLSLVVQKTDGCTFEVIVVDNSPSGDRPTEELCRQDKFTGVFDLAYVHHPEKGANEARNCGTGLARSALIGFIDDDETLPDTWVLKALEINRSPAPDCFGGPYIPYFKDPKPAWFKDEYLMVSLGERARWLNKDEAFMGGNMVYQRRWLEDLGGFARQFGRSGANLGYGDETDFMLRMAGKGARLWYDPDLYILHYTPPERMQVRYFFRSRWLHGRAKAHLLYQVPATRDSRSLLRVLLSGIKLLAGKILQMGFCYLKLPFRNRQTFPYAQNFVVERVCPQVSGFSTAWHALLLNLERSSTHRQKNL
jgi:glycosyltransferase involved in cell wall biosynthesis